MLLPPKIQLSHVIFRILSMLMPFFKVQVLFRILLGHMIFVFYVFGYMFHFGKQSGFVHAKSFKLLPNFFSFVFC